MQPDAELGGLAAAEAFRILGVRRVALVHPPWFTDEVSDKGGAYFRTRGLEVVSCTRVMPGRPFVGMTSKVREYGKLFRAGATPQRDAADATGGRYDS